MVHKGTQAVNSDALGDADNPFAAEGARLAAARMAAGFRTQADFAKRIKMRARHSVSRWESGAIAVPARRRASIAQVLETTVEAIWRSDAAGAEDGTLSALQRLSPKDFGRVVGDHRFKLRLSPAEYAPKIGLQLEQAVEQLEAGISTRAQREHAIRLIAPVISVADIAAATSRRTGRIADSSTSVGLERIAIDELFAIANELRQLAERADSTGRALLKQSMMPAEQ